MEETLAQRLRRLLDERHYGKSDAKIGKEVGVDPQTITRTLAGATEPRYETMVKLADYCGVSYEYLESGKGLAEPPPADQTRIRAQLDQARAILDSIAGELERQQGNGKP